MAQTQTVQQEMTVIQIDPGILTLPTATDVRPWEDVESAEEQARIVALAETIKQDGQLQPILARILEAEDGSPVYEVIAGRRRKAALDLLNASGKKQYTASVSVIADTDDDAAFRKSMVENTHRQNPSPMDQAMNIQAIRERFEWNGTDYATKVAKFLNISAASVRQAVKLLELPSEIQAKLHTGEISQNAAWEMLNVKPEKRAEVLATAKTVAAEEAACKVAEVEATGRKSRKAITGKAIVKPAHIVKAARVVPDATDVVKPLTRGEIMDWFDAQDGPANGHSNGAVRTWVRYFVDIYTKGQGSERTMNKHWTRMVEDADQGIEETVVEERASKAKAVKGKAKRVTA